MIKPRNFLRLEVEAAPTGLVNLVQNPSGVLGGWGWLTPVVNTTMNGIVVSGQAMLEFTTTAAANYFGTEDLPMAAGDYVASVYQYLTSGTDTPYWRTRFEFFDVNHVYISSSAQSTTLSGNNIWGTGAVQAPAGTAYVRLRYDVYSTTGAANPAAGKKMRIRQVAVATASTSAALASLAYTAPQTYLDVLDKGLSIKATRAPLDVGLLSASVLDTNLDPAQTTAVRPGRRVRLMALDNFTGAYKPLYSGKLDAAKVTYNLDRPAAEQTTVDLSGVDANAILANQGAAQGVATIAELPFVLEGAGVPWDIDGSGNQVPNATVVAVNDNASVLDQVAITRDTALAYAWTDVRGVLTARSDRTLKYYIPFPGPSGEPFRFDETDYSKIEVSFDTASIINTVYVSVVSNAGGDTIERLYGPYVDSQSVKDWGAKSATFTIQGVNGASDVEDYAQAVLDANSEPITRPSSIIVPIRTAVDVAPDKALIDLYAQALVVNAAKGISTVVRVTSIDHDIQPDKWIMTLGFDPVSAVASPTVAPPTYTQLATDGTWLTASLAGSWVNYGSGYAVTGYFRQKGQVLLRGLVKSGTGIIFTLPAGYRPSGQQIFPVISTGNALARVDVATSGAVLLSAGSGSGFVSLDGITFAAEL